MSLNSVILEGTLTKLVTKDIGHEITLTVDVADSFQITVLSPKFKNLNLVRGYTIRVIGKLGMKKRKIVLFADLIEIKYG